ncbi:response regulator [uncultured Brevundimonas sp.]|uniref:response regulator n=1 Tax=uncultured Brevundimonas sp. TaxID=213418 RepID=UPI0030EF13D7|tara:strand:- start:283 stop:795 length:513 start_codon:yes stop_codon:yes gene_type:complete
MADLQSLEILLVDDNKQFRSMTSAILKAAGCRNIRESPDGAAALKSLQDRPCDLAIVDYKMSPIDGVEFTRLVRNNTTDLDTFLPIIMMTGHSARQKVMAARDAGVTEFVTKPFTAKALLDRVHAVIHNPRPFIRTGGYFGPDRRRKQLPGYTGPMRRKSDQANVVELPE